MCCLQKLWHHLSDFQGILKRTFKSQGRVADMEAPLIVRIFRGIWRLFFGSGGREGSGGVTGSGRGKADAERKAAAKCGAEEEPLAEERAAFMTPGQRRASREADAE